MGSEASLLVAVGGGLLSFLSPCVLPLVPAYFASLAGPQVLDQGTRRVRLTLFLHSLVFVLGFSVVFVGLGALAGWAGFTISSQIQLRRIAAGLLIGFGVIMLLSLKVPWLNFEKRFSAARLGGTGYARSVLIGSIFAFAWTPCAGPVLGGLLALALDSATAWRGAYLLAFYSLGMGIPFLALGLAFDFVMPYFKRFQKYTPWVYAVSGILLITAGILTLTAGRAWTW